MEKLHIPLLYVADQKMIYLNEKTVFLNWENQGA